MIFEGAEQKELCNIQISKYMTFKIKYLKILKVMNFLRV